MVAFASSRGASRGVIVVGVDRSIGDTGRAFAGKGGIVVTLVSSIRGISCAVRDITCAIGGGGSIAGSMSLVARVYCYVVSWHWPWFLNLPACTWFGRWYTRYHYLGVVSEGGSSRITTTCQPSCAHYLLVPTDDFAESFC